MARCIDDHPQCICLCESEINRALFKSYFVKLHAQRMQGHGLSCLEVLTLLDGKKQESISSMLKWYQDVRPRISTLFQKPQDGPLGDKSPDFFESPELVQHLALNYQLIYTVRDPRAIFWSIEAQQEATPRQKRNRWECLVRNFLAWQPYLRQPNMFIVRFEDLVLQPQATMKMVYSHLGLEYSERFLEPFVRVFPKRFLWTTAVDWATGIKKDFDSSRLNEWRDRLSPDFHNFVVTAPHMREFIQQFGYG